MMTDDGKHDDDDSELLLGTQTDLAGADDVPTSADEAETANETLRRVQKEQFYKILEKKKAKSKKLIPQDEYNDALKTLQGWKKGEKHTRKQSAHREKYDIVPGTEATALRLKTTQQKIATYESIFDIIFDKHSALSHSRDSRKNYDMVNEEYYGVTEAHVKDFVSICPKCIPSQNPIKAPKMNPLKMIFSATVGCRAQMDLIDMTSQQTKDGYKWILRFIDHHCGYAHVAALKSKTAKEVGDAVICILGVAIIPEILQSDNGGEFLGECLRLIRK